jgi:hypothetical protein
MFDSETYTTSRDRLGTPIYAETQEPDRYEFGPFYDEEGNETIGSKIGGYLSLLLMIGFIFYLWAR